VQHFIQMMWDDKYREWVNNQASRATQQCFFAPQGGNLTNNIIKKNTQGL
jgi:hypothetical protein